MTTIQQLMSLRGRRALLTGAAGGLGKVIAHVLADLGADLVLVDHPSSDLLEVVPGMINQDVNVMTIACDIEQAEDRKNLIESIKSDGKGLSILINNAAFVGTSELQGWAVPFEEQSLEAWRRALEVNLTAVFDFCQGLAPLLRQTVGSSIVNIASIYGFLGPDWQLYKDTGMSNPAAYAVSKGGLIQLTRWLSTTLSPSIRVNAVSPGGIWRNQDERFVERYENRTPLGRMATEEDFVGAVAFLVTDQSRYVTGQNLVIDGGWSVW